MRSTVIALNTGTKNICHSQLPITGTVTLRNAIKQYECKFRPQNKSAQSKLIFLFLKQNIFCGYSNELPKTNVNPCPPEPGLILFENTVDSDQLATDEAIRSASTVFSSLIKNTCLQAPR